MVRVSSPAKLRPWSELTAKMVMGVVPGIWLCKNWRKSTQSQRRKSWKVFWKPVSHQCKRLSLHFHTWAPNHLSHSPRTTLGQFGGFDSSPCPPGSKFTTSRHRNRSDACIVAYIAVDFRSESTNRSENASHRKGHFLQCTSHCRNRLFWPPIENHGNAWVAKAHRISVAPPAEPRGEKKLFFVQILGGEKLLKFVEKSAGEIFLSGLRGA